MSITEQLKRYFENQQEDEHLLSLEPDDSFFGEDDNFSDHQYQEQES